MPHFGSLAPTSPSTVPDDAYEYRGITLQNVGKDPKTGKVIPHKRSEKIARQITTWLAGGASENDICVRLNIRPGQLKMCYGRELEHGTALFGMDMTQHIAQRAKKSDRMAIFVAKARMGWRDGEGKVMDTGVLAIHIHD